MGSSKSHRGGASWQSKNTPGGPEKISKGYRQVPYEGTLMSGEDHSGRKGMPASARNKSSHSSTPVKNGNPYGRS